MLINQFHKIKVPNLLSKLPPTKKDTENIFGTLVNSPPCRNMFNNTYIKIIQKAWA